MPDMRRVLHSWPWLLGWTTFLILTAGINTLAAIGHITRMPAHPLSESLYATNNIAATIALICCITQMRRIIQQRRTRDGRTDA